ncbi:proteasome subunit alpha type-3-like [Papaver somniferum]|uniref:proteasome subunit alpha type-3-like n=1 Tax=Papaver somniferum TaxID=3469 RepID=UPI000E705C94|nr:proteasome subunit alpha type-3-like [Papaver somniferum]XP_026460122.1 proteasome subunit alpha type-3-like [Papaver somniferum]
MGVIKTIDSLKPYTQRRLYFRTYGEAIPVKELAERVSSYVHLCTLYWWMRPFRCGVILGGYDRDGPQLYMVEPSSISHRY